MKFSFDHDFYFSSDNRLLRYLRNENKTKTKIELMQMSTLRYHDYFCKKTCTSLQSSLHRKRSKEVIFKMIDIAGKQLVMKTSINGWTALHTACHLESVSLDIVSKLIMVGGKELVMMKNVYGETVLHWAFRKKKHFSG